VSSGEVGNTRSDCPPAAAPFCAVPRSRGFGQSQTGLCAQQIQQLTDAEVFLKFDPVSRGKTAAVVRPKKGFDPPKGGTAEVKSQDRFDGFQTQIRTPVGR